MQGEQSVKLTLIGSQGKVVHDGVVVVHDGFMAGYLIWHNLTL
jgi:hypothetical protein